MNRAVLPCGRRYRPCAGSAIVVMLLVTSQTGRSPCAFTKTAIRASGCASRSRCASSGWRRAPRRSVTGPVSPTIASASCTDPISRTAAGPWRAIVASPRSAWRCFCVPPACAGRARCWRACFVCWAHCPRSRCRPRHRRRARRGRRGRRGHRTPSPGWRALSLRAPRCCEHSCCARPTSSTAAWQSGAGVRARGLSAAGAAAGGGDHGGSLSRLPGAGGHGSLGVVSGALRAVRRG